MIGGTLLVLGISGQELNAEEMQRFRRLQPAGYVLFSRNIATPEQTRKLTDALREISHEEPIIAIDQEGGRVTRTKEIAPTLPSAPAMAVLGNPAKIASAAALTADLLRLLGCNLNFAPVLDLDHFPAKANALTGRSWGRDPQRVIDHAGQWNRSLRKRGLASCGKHFPAGGRAISDPHHGLPTSPATWEDLLREDLLPYTALMPELDAVMLAHVEFPEIDKEFPASLSPKIIRRLLRDQLGFDRQIILTDDLDMGAITQRFGRGPDAKLAIEAGNDLALICHDTTSAELAAAAISELPYWMLDEATERLERLRKKLNAPLKWSAAHWEKTCAAMDVINQAFPENFSTASDSPVAGY